MLRQTCDTGYGSLQKYIYIFSPVQWGQKVQSCHSLERLCYLFKLPGFSQRGHMLKWPLCILHMLDMKYGKSSFTFQDCAELENSAVVHLLRNKVSGAALSRGWDKKAAATSNNGYFITECRGVRYGHWDDGACIGGYKWRRSLWWRWSGAPSKQVHIYLYHFLGLIH